MSSPGMVFVIGMERCYTTSLAQWLVDAGLCDWFVDGIKEPSMFSSDTAQAMARWQRERASHDRWLLDASVCYAGSEAALDAISRLENYRVILCLRDQLDRTVSAYRIYRALYGLPPEVGARHPASTPKFGDDASRERLRGDPLVPALFTRNIECRHTYTMIRYAEVDASAVSREAIDDCDEAFERLERQRLPARIVYEWSRWTKTGAYPPLSILGGSYYAAALARMVRRFDPSRMMVLTLSQPACRAGIGTGLARFLGADAPADPLAHLHPSTGWGFDVPDEDVVMARTLVSTEFAKDTDDLLERIGGTPGLDLSLFAPEALFHAA